MLSLVEFLMIAGLATLTAAWVSYGFQRLRASQAARSQTSKLSDLEGTTGRPAPGAWHTPRRGSRYHVQCETEFVSPQGPGKGTLVDLSRVGWRITSEQPMTRGTTLSLRVCLPGQPAPLDVEHAIVRWADGTEFGVELISLRPESASQLSNYLTAHAPQPAGKPLSALSPFSYN